MFCNQCGTANADGSRFCSNCGGPIPSSTPVEESAADGSVADSEFGLPIGAILADRYRILGILGIGGMGRVYLAEDQRLGTRVAIKVLREILSHDPGTVKRLIAEVRPSMTLSHPNVARVLSCEDGGMVKFLVMEYVDGGTIASRIAEQGMLPEAEARRITIEACKGLEHAHDQKLIHGNINPLNILLGKTGAVKIADFGIARQFWVSWVSQPTSQIDPECFLYMSPEELDGKSNAASDIYSLGVVLYEMLTGQPPFRSADITSQIREVPPDPPEGISPALSAIVLKCLEKKPERRFASARALREELDGTAAANRKAEEARRRVDDQRKEEERREQAEIEANRRKTENPSTQQSAPRFAISARLHVFLMFMLQFMGLILILGIAFPASHERGLPTVVLVIAAAGVMVAFHYLLSVVGALIPVRCRGCRSRTRYFGFGWWPFKYRYACAQCGHQMIFEVTGRRG